MIGAIGAIIMVGEVHAARPFITDDARLTTARSCQLESWARIVQDRAEVWALPACNPTGNLELTFGGGHVRYDAGPSVSDQVLQVKTLFRPLEADDWGWGIAAGVVRHPSSQPGPNGLGNTYAYLPISMAFNGDRSALHANIGALKDRATGTHALTWGLGVEHRITPRWLGIAETFGDNHARPFVQVGARFSIVPDRVQVDSTVGRQVQGPSSGRWISFGLRVTPDRLW